MIKYLWGILFVALTLMGGTIPEQPWETRNDRDIFYDVGNVGINVTRNIDAELEVSGLISGTIITASESISAPAVYSGGFPVLTTASPVSITASAPISYTGSNLALNYNSTNLKITDSQLNTIQDIATSSSPTFANINASSSVSAPVIYIGGSAAVSITGGDSRYVNVTGDTMTGDLNVPNLYASTMVSSPTLSSSNISNTGNITTNQLIASASVSSPLLNSSNISNTNNITTNSITSSVSISTPLISSNNISNTNNITTNKLTTTNLIASTSTSSPKFYAGTFSTGNPGYTFALDQDTGFNNVSNGTVEFVSNAGVPTYFDGNGINTLNLQVNDVASITTGLAVGAGWAANFTIENYGSFYNSSYGTFRESLSVGQSSGVPPNYILDVYDDGLSSAPTTNIYRQSDGTAGTVHALNVQATSPDVGATETVYGIKSDVTSSGDNALTGYAGYFSATGGFDIGSYAVYATNPNYYGIYGDGGIYGIWGNSSASIAGYFTSATGSGIQVNVAGGANTALAVNSSSTGDVGFFSGPGGSVYINSSGNVGIASSTPSQKLQVSGNISTSGVLYTGLGSVSAPGHSFTGDPNTGMYSASADRVDFTAGGVRGISFFNTTQDEVVVNEDSNDVNFRVESDVSALGFVLDATTGNIGIGGASSLSRSLDISGTGMRILRNGTADGYDALILDSQYRTFYYNDSGGVLWDMNPFPSDGSSAATFRLCRETNTTGGCSISLYKGNGTTTTAVNFTSLSGGANSLNNESVDIDTVIRGDNDSSLAYFDAGTDEVGIGTFTPDSKLHVHTATAGSVTAASNTVITAENSTHAYLSLLTPNASESGVLFGNVGHNAAGGIVYNNSSTSNGLQFRTNGNSTKMVIDSDGNVGIGSTSAGTKLAVTGDISSTGKISATNNFGLSTAVSLTVNNPNTGDSGNTYGLRSSVISADQAQGEQLYGLSSYVRGDINSTIYGVYSKIDSSTFTLFGYAGYFDASTGTFDGGATGVYANGLNTGVEAVSTNGTGVSATGIYGVFAASSFSGGAAVYATQSNASGYGVQSDAEKNYFNGNVGIGATPTGARLTVSGATSLTGSLTVSPTGSITSSPPYFKSTTIIMKSPDGSCSACGPNNSDVWSCTSTTCPN